MDYMVIWNKIMNNKTNKKRAIQKKIDRMVKRIVKRFHPESVILFGSRALGRSGVDSDVDLLVVMEIEGSKRAKQIEVGVALHDIRVPKDVIVVRPEEIERRRNIPGTLIRTALREGKVLYAREH